DGGPAAGAGPPGVGARRVGAAPPGGGPAAGPPGGSTPGPTGGGGWRASAPLPAARARSRRLPLGAAGWGGLLFGLVQGRCRELDIAPRFVASRADRDGLVS